MEEGIDTERIGYLLKELVRTQTTILRCDISLAMKKTQEQIAECVNEARENLTEQAKLFGVKIKKITTNYEAEKIGVQGILAKYEETMKAVVEPFDNELKNVLAIKSEVQQEFIALVADFVPKFAKGQAKSVQLKGENLKIATDAIKAIATGDNEQAIQKLTTLQERNKNNQPEALKALTMSYIEQMKSKVQLINACDKQKEDIAQRRKSAIQQVKADKKMELSKVRKQDIVNKILGSLFSKFNGTNKFIKNALDPLKSKMTEIKETHIPNIKAGVDEKIASFRTGFETKKTELENAISKRVDEYAKKLATAKESAKMTYQDIKKEISEGIVDAQKMADDILKTTTTAAKETYQGAKNAVIDKAKTVAQYASEIPNKANELKKSVQANIEDRKNAILEGARNIQTSAKETWENTKEGVATWVQNTLENAKEGATNFANSAVDKAVSAKDLIVRSVTSIGEAGKNTYKGIIGKALEAKMNLIKRMQSKLEQQNEKITERMAQLNGEYVDTTEQEIDS